MTMVILRNIKKIGKTIEAEYFPENQEIKGFLRINTENGDIVEHIGAMGYEHTTCPSHVKHELLRLSVHESFPKEKIVIWY